MKKILLLLIPIFFLFSCTNSSSSVPVITESGSTKTILAIGDSLTIWYGLPLEESYPSQLEKKLKELWYLYVVQNAGISGDTSAWLLSRIDWILDGQSPDLIILCIGANDALQWKSVDDMEKNIRTIIGKIQAKKIPILFVGMRAPFNLGNEYRKQFDGTYQKIADEYKLPFMPFFLDGVALNQKYNQDDRIHPNREWYWIIVSNIIKFLDTDLLKK